MPGEQSIGLCLGILFLGEPFFDKHVHLMQVVCVFGIRGHVIPLPALFHSRKPQSVTVGPNHIFLPVRCPLLPNPATSTHRIARHSWIILFLLRIFLFLHHRQIGVMIPRSATFMNRHDVIEYRGSIDVLAVAFGAACLLNNFGLRAMGFG